MPKSLIIFLLCLIAHGCIQDCCARRVRTTRKGLRCESPVKTLEEKTPDKLSCDTPDVVDNVDRVVSITGYEKTLRSRIETFYVANLSDTRTLVGLAVEIEYSDVNGKQLHSREEHIKVTVPPLGRRQVSIPTWDRQFVMYYHKSPLSKRAAQATPYHVSIIVKTVLLEK